MSDIELITKSFFVTPDGVEHPSMLLAQHWLAHNKVAKALDLHDYRPDQITDILNVLCSKGTREHVRTLMDLCDQMEHAHD